MWQRCIRVCVCVCVYTYINFSLQSFVTVLPNFSLRAPVYCPGLLPASSSRVGEAPFTASRKLGCNPDPAPLSFTVLPNLFTGDNDPASRSYCERRYHMPQGLPTPKRRADVPGPRAPASRHSFPPSAPHKSASFLSFPKQLPLVLCLLPVFSSCHQAPGQTHFPASLPSIFSMSAAFPDPLLISALRPCRPFSPMWMTTCKPWGRLFVANVYTYVYMYIYIYIYIQVCVCV